jgi:flagellar biogenesis protein FliO
VNPFEDPSVLIRILLGFGLTACLVILCRKLLNRLPSLLPGEVQSPGRTLFVHSVGPKQKLILVEIVGRIYLLSSTHDRLEVLDRIENEEVQPLLDKFSTIPSTNQTFPFVFQQIQTKVNKNIQK